MVLSFDLAMILECISVEMQSNWWKIIVNGGEESYQETFIWISQNFYGIWKLE